MRSCASASFGAGHERAWGRRRGCGGSRPPRPTGRRSRRRASSGPRPARRAAGSRTPASASASAAAACAARTSDNDVHQPAGHDDDLLRLLPARRTSPPLRGAAPPPRSPRGSRSRGHRRGGRAACRSPARRARSCPAPAPRRSTAGHGWSMRRVPGRSSRHRARWRCAARSGESSRIASSSTSCATRARHGAAVLQVGVEVEQLAHRGDRGVELHAPAVVVGDLARWCWWSLRRSSFSSVGELALADTARHDARAHVVVHHRPQAAQELERALDALVGPEHGVGRRIGRHHVEARGVGPVAVDHVLRVDAVPLRLRHRADAVVVDGAAVALELRAGDLALGIERRPRPRRARSTRCRPWRRGARRCG